ncbi:hypothetical protein Aci011_022 [Acinetobacter phage vB_AbaM_B09_Aci01-1]|uniref:Uncharacterized protein n=2 Tax=Saclayvirus TaxID=2733128 RepID=A0A386KMU6_9CAUD|nr:hypothetical protein HOU29_gp159 [Acinetobacter phage vB_AbaM_B09_Aci01-1]YP_009813245.1 hypothetical protein HOU30_gp167 [Acinetobacter phage vB_AbaM_B09_Aci02-2]AYD85651.1 hypothetical protein Aci011_022 [Acinetobacter phage vB_AbaM_B09_Aci01-1]AYD85813.1 hypothetical protein Aci022_023 [Acinetobacter phage vB_AbaM_B09_Aci02-2]
MLDDILAEGIESVDSVGLVNIMFKTSERSYCLNLQRKFLMRFVLKNDLELNDEWFDKTEQLNDSDYSKLIEVLKCM